MTTLHKPVRRVTTGLVREAGQARNVVVIMRPPNLLGFKAKGCRKEYVLPVETCYVMAVRAYAASKKREQIKSRKEGRK
jgi:hypothetical protein